MVGRTRGRRTVFACAVSAGGVDFRLEVCFGDLPDGAPLFVSALDGRCRPLLPRGPDKSGCSPAAFFVLLMKDMIPLFGRPAFPLP